jgi:hypothetical protein
MKKKVFNKHFYSYTLKMEADSFSETLVSIYQTTRRHISEDCNTDIRRRHVLKSRELKLFCTARQTSPQLQKSVTDFSCWKQYQETLGAVACFHLFNARFVEKALLVNIQ